MPVVRSSRVVTPRGVQPASIYFEGEKILEVIDGSTPAGTNDVIDYGDLVIMPGLVQVRKSVFRVFSKCTLISKTQLIQLRQVILQQ